jgi:hypothetical protein
MALCHGNARNTSRSDRKESSPDPEIPRPMAIEVKNTRLLLFVSDVAVMKDDVVMAILVVVVVVVVAHFAAR